MLSFGACLLLLRRDTGLLLLRGDAGLLLLRLGTCLLLLRGDARFLLLGLDARLLLEGALVGGTARLCLGLRLAQHLGLVGSPLRGGLAARGGLGGGGAHPLGVRLLAASSAAFLACSSACFLASCGALCILGGACELLGKRLGGAVVGGDGLGEGTGKRHSRRRDAYERYRCSTHSNPSHGNS